ncbi:MAG: hypothetical protein WBB22_01045, partial [Anaerolineae bacterium]
MERRSPDLYGQPRVWLHASCVPTRNNPLPPFAPKSFCLASARSQSAISPTRELHRGAPIGLDLSG